MNKRKGLTRMVIRFIDAEFEQEQYTMGQDIHGVKNAANRMRGAYQTALQWGYTRDEFNAELERLKAFVEDTGK